MGSLYWENLQSKGWKLCSFAHLLLAAGFRGIRICEAVIRADRRDMGAAFGSITHRKFKFRTSGALPVFPTLLQITCNLLPCL